MKKNYDGIGYNLIDEPYMDIARIVLMLLMNKCMY